MPDSTRFECPPLASIAEKSDLARLFTFVNNYVCKPTVSKIGVEMAQLPEISPAEWQVMNVVWERQPVAASDIIKALQVESEWTPATIRTFLHRLVKKGALKYVADGNRYFYRSAVAKSATIKKVSRSFLQSVFGGETGPLIAHFVQSSNLSADEIEQLRQLLERKEAK